MSIEANDQRNERCVDELEPEVAAYDVIDSTFRRSRHSDEILQDNFDKHTCSEPQCANGQQVGIGLPLPCFESKGLEHEQGQHRKSDADDTYSDCFFLTFIHTVRKDTLFLG